MGTLKCQFLTLTHRHAHGTVRTTSHYMLEGETRIAGCHPLDNDRGRGMFLHSAAQRGHKRI